MEKNARRLTDEPLDRPGILLLRPCSTTDNPGDGVSRTMPSSPESMNELTFVARLGTATVLRAERMRDDGLTPLIARGDVEERQIDADGKVRRCDIRLSTSTGRKLASGEMKRPEVREGRDPCNEALRRDARRKAVARGLPYYFTCNMAKVVLFSVASRPGEPDPIEGEYELAPIAHSRDVDPCMGQITERWGAFLDDLEDRLKAVASTRPSVTSADVVALRDAITAVAEEAIDRVSHRVEQDADLADSVRDEAADDFSFAAALKPSYRAVFHRELLQILKFGIFVAAQKLVLYRMLEDAGPRRSTPFRLDPLAVPESSSDPRAIRAILDHAFSHAISRSGDYQTAFLPNPLADLVFLEPESHEEIHACRVGEVWHHLLATVQSASWVSISQNLVGFLYEVIVDPEFRHLLGQFYTREDVVDILVTFAVTQPADLVLDPAAGGGSFVRSAYHRKRALGDTHEDALAATWGLEITGFAAELSTISLATADTREAAAYPRVLLTDFFDVRPGLVTQLEVPGEGEKLRVPTAFDAIVGNPPYISYRHQKNQAKVLNALAELPNDIELPKFTGKSDAYVWFLVHATQFLRDGGRLGFVVSSAILFSDYGIPLIRFLGHHYRILAVVDSMVERWFPDADTNTVLLLLERRKDLRRRRETSMRFIRLRRLLAQLLPPPGDGRRRQTLEDLIDALLAAPDGGDDPRWTVNLIPQGNEAGLSFTGGNEEDASEDDGGDEDDE
jgi:hypothetical protein